MAQAQEWEYTLLSINGWSVGCYHDLHDHCYRGHSGIIRRKGFAQERTHRTRNLGDWQAYELTDAGIEHIRAVFGDARALTATRNRQFYRDNEAEILAERKQTPKED